MMQKAFIEKRIDQFSYKVRIPKYNMSASSAYKTATEDLATAIVAVQPGIHPVYDIGDVVFVEFENDATSKPIIIGQLYRQDGEGISTSDANIRNLSCQEGLDDKPDYENRLTYVQDLLASTPTSAAVQILIDQMAELRLSTAQIAQDLQKTRSHIGSIIYSSTLDTEQKVIDAYGGVHWQKIEGKFLLGQQDATEQIVGHAINSEGGSETVTLDLNEIPPHHHSQISFYDDANYNHGTIPTNMYRTSWPYDAGSTTRTYYTQSDLFRAKGNGYDGDEKERVNGGAAHNNMPPYKTVYIWERTE